ncbi:hypothetical protein AWV72_01514 [Lactiplantibacillus plantarum]|nr:hypothetical protein AWV72_01514 [Lactiplantibacillus plantarum]
MLGRTNQTYLRSLDFFQRPKLADFDLTRLERFNNNSC